MERRVERGFAPIRRAAANPEFLFDAGNGGLQLLAALFLLRIAQCGIRRQRAFMRAQADS